VTSTIRSTLKGRVARTLARLCVGAGALGTLLTAAERTQRRAVRGRRRVPLVRRRARRGFQVLLYHRVNDDRAPMFPAIPISAFRTQMRMLAENFRVLPLDELVLRAERDDLPERAVAVTFDDGYRDNYEHACPILRGFGLPATIFVATGAVDGRVALWHDRLIAAIRDTAVPALSIAGRQYSLRTVPDKRTAFHAMRATLLTCSPSAREELIAEVTAQLGSGGRGARPAMLRWHELEQMAHDRITIGAHTVSHPILSRMPLSEAIDEIAGAKARIEKRLGRSVALFAYPNGRAEDFNDAIKAAVKDAGFLAAVTTIPGTNDALTERFALRRLSLGDEDGSLFALRLGWYKFAS